jgi:hypothetical protein
LAVTSSSPESAVILQRMVDAVEQVRQRLLRVARILGGHGIPYAVVGGNAVAAWVATVDRAAVRNTQDVDILIRRNDLARVRQALEADGFVHQQVMGVDLFLDHAGAGPREAVHVIFANEIVRTGEPAPNPDVSSSRDLGAFQVIDLEALVRIKLTAFRDKDRVHLRDLLGVGLVDATWPNRLSPELGRRLQVLLDSPEG